MDTYLPKISLPGVGTSRILKSIVIQSPLAGISDQVFRNLVRRWAPESLLFTEMVNAKSLELGHGLSKLDEISKEEGPIGVQIFDYRPKEMADAAKRAEEAGAFLVDINMGCPVKKIARKGGGSGLLKEPLLAAEIVKKVKDAVKIPVTVKTRIGWSTESANPIEFALLMQDSGAQMLTLHGRTREQGFSGNANWETIQKVKNILSIPVIANGDIRTPKDAIQCLKITGADGIMIGRGSMGSPWLVGEIDAALRGDQNLKIPNTIDRLEITKEHLLSLVKAKGDHGLLIARKHMNWSCQGFEGASTLRSSLMRAKTASEAEKLIENKIITLNNSSS